jgi:hypothetical protein
MPQLVRLLQVDTKGELAECAATPLTLEERLEDWLEQDIKILSNDVMVIGRQVQTAQT